MFQELLQKHIARGILGRKMLFIDNGTIALASDLGLKRAENQDRVAVMKFRSSRTFYTLISVVDGMGGMRDGEKSAELAISTFFSSLLATIHLGPQTAITHATLATNDAVFAYTNAKGGSTLSAILLCSDGQNITVNVGDSRIYAKEAVFNKVIRLSVDDSLAEAVGGSGTELIQFIGMGEGIRPHVAHLPPDISQVYLTTDGIHYIEPKTLSNIVENADNVIQVVERLVATARWCGGPDNASICAIDLERSTFDDHIDDSAVVQVSDPVSTLQFIWDDSPIEKQSLPYSEIRDESENTFNLSKDSGTAQLASKVDHSKQPKDEKEAPIKMPPKKKRASSKKKVDKPNQEAKMQIKMTICDEVNSENGEVKDDSSN